MDYKAMWNGGLKGRGTNRRISISFGNVVMALIIMASLVSYSHAARIKEISYFEGVRKNHLIGYGLVVGLDGTGDKSGTAFTVQSLVNMLNRFGIKVDANSVQVKNVAAVVVTAALTPFQKPGNKIDVLVSSIGDSKSLQGGTLLFTPLKGSDGEVYAVAQGSVSVGGFILSGSAGSSTQKNHLTVGRIPGGAMVEKEVPMNFSEKVYLILNHLDFTTSYKVAGRINNLFGGKIARSLDGSRIQLEIPGDYINNVVGFLARVEDISVPVDTISKVVVNERTGTIVIGENVRISTVAVSHGNLSVEIKATHKISQPPPFSSGTTVNQLEEQVSVREEKARLLKVEEGSNLGDLIRALNAIGVTPRDLIAILQAIRAAGAMQADLEII